MAKKNSVFAMAAEPAATPVKPKMPATIEITKKMSAQRNISASLIGIATLFCLPRLIPQHQNVIGFYGGIRDLLSLAIYLDIRGIGHPHILAFMILHRERGVIPIDPLDG